MANNTATTVAAADRRTRLIGLDVSVARSSASGGYVAFGRRRRRHHHRRHRPGAEAGFSLAPPRRRRRSTAADGQTYFLRYTTPAVQCHILLLLLLFYLVYYREAITHSSLDHFCFYFYRFRFYFFLPSAALQREEIEICASRSTSAGGRTLFVASHTRTHTRDNKIPRVIAVVRLWRRRCCCSRSNIIPFGHPSDTSLSRPLLVIIIL